METEGGIKIFRNNWKRNRKSILKNLPVQVAANGAKTSWNKKCNIDEQHRHLRREIITALHTHR